MAYLWLVFILSTTVAVLNQIGCADASINIGVCYGMVADNLPPAADVINLYKKYQIGSLRLFDPNPDALNALRGSQIEVTVGIRNEDLPRLAASVDAVNSWFATNIQPYINDIVFPYIAVGNEVIPGVYAPYILPVMQSLQNILDAKQFHGTKVSTVLSGATLAQTYPPSNSVFTDEAGLVLRDILRLLSQEGSPLLINVYPYFAYAGDPAHVSLDYASFRSTTPVVRDGPLSYFNLFDAMVDSFVWAMEKLGVSDVDVVVTESGWPSAGNGNFTTPELASIYNQNFVKHMVSAHGTPKRPGAVIEGFIFAMFNENRKPAGVEQNFGLFYPNMQPVYPIFS